MKGDTLKGKSIETTTWMDVFNVPSQNTVDESIQEHHQHHQKQVVLVIFNWWDGYVVPLDTNALYLVECKILCTKSEASCRQKRLERRNQHVNTKPRI